jgi:hypothetical protein
LRNIWLLALIAFFATGYSQVDSKKQSYFQPEYTFGKVIPNYADTFPKSSIQQGITLNFGAQITDTSSWGKYYNYPETGLMIHYANYGNNKVFGHSVGINPYVSFPVFNKAKADYHFKIGMGMAVFNTHFDSLSNNTNNMIGSKVTWDFKLFLYRNLIAKEDFNLRFGFGFSHESNGHTVMPNMGINSALFSLSGQFYKNKDNLNTTPPRVKGLIHSPKKFFIHYREGIGWHAQNRAEGPKVDRILPVYAASLSGGYIYNNHIKMRVGLTHKYYQQYKTHLDENYVEGLSENKFMSSSAIVLFVGSEFLMSHVSMDTELGVNLYKPFYRKFNPSTKVGVSLMKLISTRLGVNLYLFNTNNLPKHNFFIGGNINANLGKADFTEFSLGYTYTFNNNN